MRGSMPVLRGSMPGFRGLGPIHRLGAVLRGSGPISAKHAIQDGVVALCLLFNPSAFSLRMPGTSIILVL